MIVGGDDDLQRIAWMVRDVPGLAPKSTEEILEVSKRIHHPNDMISQHETDIAEARERLPQLAERRPDAASLEFLKRHLSGNFSWHAGGGRFSSP